MSLRAIVSAATLGANGSLIIKGYSGNSNTENDSTAMESICWELADSKTAVYV
jgi:hypothetical protein